jgi:hypothetical protein
VPGGGHIGDGCVRDLLLLIASGKDPQTAADPEVVALSRASLRLPDPRSSRLEHRRCPSPRSQRRGRRLASGASWSLSNKWFFALSDHKGVFYEQVTGVKGLFFAFSFLGLLLLLLLLVSLLSTGFLFALLMSCLGASSVQVGVREESRCCHLSVGLRRPKRARSHRNTVSSQRINRIISRPFVRRTVCRALGCSRGGEATRPACGLPQQRPCFWPACRLLRLSADPTVEAPSLSVRSKDMVGALD